MLSGSVIILVFLGGLPFTQGGCLSENQDSLGSCAKKCTGDAARAACVSDCLIDLDVPYTCATCLGTQYDCGRRFCRTDCSGNSSTCATCIDSLCSSCIKALNFPSKAAKAGPSLTQLFMVAEGDFGGKEEEGPVSLLAQAAGTCESGGDVVESCGSPCYGHADPSGCYARCSINACFSTCTGCVQKSCFESCRRSVGSYECATCIHGICDGCPVSYSSMKQTPVGSQTAPILP
ncbi:unnamed protein product [Symbiodinium necroappetens]|uniref:TNFR-Cys domain-containing protein n=1 Tax=Symbiodinium necroappetens TaxID=1628268 RepID=A0A812Y432_9DINO|nr:unnamed protein product [Symbiodinium necroappetens]